MLQILNTPDDRLSSARVVSLTSVAQLRQRAVEWDDLWQRSDVVTPAPRAEMIAMWLETFGKSSALRALAVEYEGRLVAALPLILQRAAGPLSVAALPSSDWCNCGELLWDAQVDASIALTPLASALRKLKCTLLWLDGIPLETQRWRLFRDAMQEAGLQTHVDPRYETGVVDIHHNWETYRASWSRTHRRNMGRYARRLQEQAALQLRVFSEIAPDDVEPLLRRGFAVEDRSWKARTDSSVLRSGGIFAYYVRLAKQLASWNQLELVFLEIGDRPIAFELGWTAKGVYHAAKVGYDEEYAASSPGQLLRSLLFEQFFADPQRTAVDFMGVLTDATGKWSSRTYPVGRIVATMPGLVGAGLLGGYRHVLPQLRRLRQRQQKGGKSAEVPAPESDSAALSPV